ncbi:MAG: molybdopterin-dependent oxidoreductase, partial [Gemmatimonadetes bacterium]|nr:molybdopterin-dependent oxidoreductase [Gemmatimonadota bacterium]
MTSVHNTSRRSFLKVSAVAGGGLLLELTLPGAFAADANAQVLAPNAFVRIARDGTVTLVMHKVEMGQGTYTSMSMLIAEELEVDLAAVRLEHAPPDDELYHEPLFGVQETGGSTSVRGNWEPLRIAGATARTLLIAAAAQTWNVEPASCRAENGRVIHDASGRSLGYGELVDVAVGMKVPRKVV